MNIKVLSWNVWIHCRLPEVRKFLRKSNADVIGLQEVKDNDSERDVIGYLANLGYQHVFAPVEKVWGGKTYRDGPAIFSKYPITESATINLSKENNRMAVRADIVVHRTKLHVFSTHLIHTHQQQSDLQEQQVNNLIAELPRDHAIVVGDFNATPESNVINKMRSALTDTDPESQPTWSAYREGCAVCQIGEVNTRLDYIFVSKDLQTNSFEVGRSAASDHLPILVQVEV